MKRGTQHFRVRHRVLRGTLMLLGRGEERRGEEGEELRQRTRETVVRNPSGPRRASAGPAGPPEEDPKEKRVATAEASVQVTAWNRFILLPGQAGAVEEDAEGEEAAVGEPHTAVYHLQRSEITHWQAAVSFRSIRPLSGGRYRELRVFLAPASYTGVKGLLTLRKNSSIYRLLRVFACFQNAWCWLAEVGLHWSASELVKNECDIGPRIKGAVICKQYSVS